LIVEHHYDTFVGEDHFSKRGPVIYAHWDLRRGVDVVDQAGILDGSGVVSRVCKV